VEKDASEEQVRKAYRDLVARYHPDRLHHLGEEFRLMAARKTVALNRAYAEIMDEGSGRRT
jgi:DnaJ like chaperone protein